MKGCITCVFALICAGLTAQAAAQSVKVTFYYINLGEWNEHGSTSTFQSILAAEANTYCSSHLVQCGLYQWLPLSPFRSSDVIILDGFPAKVKSNIVLEVKVQMNVTMNITNPAQTHLSVDVVRTILKNSRQALKIATESWIVYIDGEHLSPPPDYRANEIIIPIAFVVVLLLIIVTLSLQYWRKKKDQAEKKMAKKLQASHGTSQVSPNHVLSVDYLDGNSKKANQLGVIYPPSRQHRTVDQNSSLHTATPSNISMTTDVPDAAKYNNDKDNEKEKRKHHKKRHRKKKPREGEVTEEHQDWQDYNYQRFAQPGHREDAEEMELRRSGLLA